MIKNQEKQQTTEKDPYIYKILNLTDKNEIARLCLITQRIKLNIFRDTGVKKIQIL